MINLVIQQKEQWALVKEQAEAVKKAGLLPQAMTAEQAAIIVLKGQELGIGTMRALEGLYVVNGKIGFSAALVMSLIRERCPQAKISTKRKDDKGCVLVAERPGQDPETFQFLEEDAMRAGLIRQGNPWTKFPKAMYWSRTVTEMGRQYFPDILGGAVYTNEELGGQVEKDIFVETDLPETPLVSGKPGTREHLLPQKSNGSNGAGSLADRINQAKEQKEEKVIKETGEVQDINPTEELPTFDKFETREPKLIDDQDEFGQIRHSNISHWDALSISGSYSGLTFREILKQLGKEKFVTLYNASVKSLDRMKSEGKEIPESTQKTFKALEACVKEVTG